MLRTVSFVLVAAVLSGCVANELNYLHKTGSTASQRQTAFDQCRIAAAQQVPNQSRTVYTPGVYTAGTTYCRGSGSTTTCNTVGGLNIPGSVDTVDDNDGLRQRTIQRCLASKGITINRMKTCPRGSSDYQGDEQPPLSQISCASARVQY